MSDTSFLEGGHDPVSKGSQLCLSCGLCCQGLLHDHADLETDETELANQLGLPFHPGSSDSRAFSLPCPLYKDDKCSVYPNRPKVCGNYQCDLLKKLLQGLISFEKATALVKSAKDLMRAIRKQLGPGDPSQSIWQQIAGFLGRHGNNTNSEEFRRANAKLLLDEKQLAFICRHFEMDESLVAATRPSAAVKVPSKGKGSLTPSAHVLFGDHEGQIVISNVETGEYSALIGVGADMWRALVEYDDLEDVVMALLRQYDIDKATLRTDLHAFVEGLLARGLLEPSGAPCSDTQFLTEDDAPTGQ